MYLPILEGEPILADITCCALKSRSLMSNFEGSRAASRCNHAQPRPLLLIFLEGYDYSMMHSLGYGDIYKKGAILDMVENFKN